ncbi:MAG: hypothetical protein WC604_02425 [Candidatus Gracilibacteria bacterium]
MARTAQINYQRVTFSFPEKVVERLREKIGNQNMSKFVVEAVEKELGDDVRDVEEFMRGFRELCSEMQKSRRDYRSSLEILREIRHGKK